LDHIITRNLSQASYNNYLNRIKIYTNWLKERNIIEDNSFLLNHKGYSRPEPILTKKYYPEETVRKFLGVRPRWLHYFLFLSFYFGFRPNEVSRLETADINLKERYIDVRPGVQKIAKQDYLAIPNIFINKFHEIITWRQRQ
jgi:integrase